MRRFIHHINSSNKLTAEEHISLYLYKIYSENNNFDSNYEEFVINNNLIDNYNKMLLNKEDTIIFSEYLKNNTRKIDEFLKKFNNKPWKYSKPIIWNDRKKDSYFIKNLMLSHQFEVFIDTIFIDRGIDIGLYYDKEGQYNKGESEAGIEIKYDIRSSETGNLYIEYAEKLNAKNENWIPSGIFKKDNTRYFLTGMEDKFWILRKNDLLILIQEIINGNHRGKCRLVEAKRGTSLGFIIPKEEASLISLSLEDIVSELEFKYGNVL